MYLDHQLYRNTVHNKINELFKLIFFDKINPFKTNFRSHKYNFRMDLATNPIGMGAIFLNILKFVSLLQFQVLEICCATSVRSF